MDVELQHVAASRLKLLNGLQDMDVCESIQKASKH
jgi:hypothetical protein